MVACLERPAGTGDTADDDLAVLDIAIVKSRP